MRIIVRKGVFILALSLGSGFTEGAGPPQSTQPAGAYRDAMAEAFLEASTAEARVPLVRSARAVRWVGATREAVKALAPHLRDAQVARRRAAALAFGELGDAAADELASLKAAIRDPDAVVRARVVRCLAGLRGLARPAGAELTAAAVDRDPTVRAGALFALAAVRPASADRLRALFVGGLGDPAEEVREAGACGLAVLGPDAAAASEALLTLAKDDPSTSVRTAAARACGRLGPSAGDVVVGLVSLLQNESEGVRVAARSALIRVGAKAAPTLISIGLASNDPVARALAAEVLGQVAQPPDVARAALLPLLNDKSPKVRQAACTGLANSKPAGEGQFRALAGCLADPSQQVRYAAAEALFQAGSAAGTALGQATRHPRPEVAALAAYTLARLGPDARYAIRQVVALLEECPDDDEAPIFWMQGPLPARPPILPGRRAAALLCLKHAGKEVILPIADLLTTTGNPAARAGALEVLRSHGSTARPALEVMAERLGGDDDAVVIMTLLAISENARKPLSELMGKRAERVVAVIVGRIESSADPLIQFDFPSSLTRLADSDPRLALPAIRRLLASRKVTVQFQLIEALGRCAPSEPGVREELLKLLGHPNASCYSAACVALERIELDERDLPRVLVGLSKPGRQEREHAARLLKRFGTKAVPPLSRALADPAFREGAIDALGHLGPAAADAVPALRQALITSPAANRSGVIAAIGNVGPAAESSIPDLLEALKVEATWRAAAQALGGIGRRAEMVVPALVVRLGATGNSVDTELVAESLARFGSRARPAAPALAARLRAGVISCKDADRSSLVKSFAALGESTSWSRVFAAFITLEPGTHSLVPLLVELETDEELAALEPRIRERAREELRRLLKADGTVDLILLTGKPANPRSVIELEAGPVVQRSIDVLRRGDESQQLDAIRTLVAQPGVTPDSTLALIEAARDGTPRVRAQALYALAGIVPERREFLRLAREALGSTEEGVREAAVHAMACARPVPVEELRVLVNDADPEIGQAAAHALGLIGPAARAAVPDLLELAKTKHRKARYRSRWALNRISAEGADVEGLLKGSLNDPNSEVRMAAVLGLSRASVPPKDIEKTLVAALGDDSPTVRAAAAEGLSRRKVGPARVTLEKRLADTSWVVRYWSSRALVHAGGTPEEVIRWSDVALRDATLLVRESAVTALKDMPYFPIGLSAGAVRALLLRGAADDSYAMAILARLGPRAKVIVPDAILLLGPRGGQPATDKRQIQIVRLLGRVGPDASPAGPLLTSFVTGRTASAELRRESVLTLLRMGPAKRTAAPFVLEELKDRLRDEFSAESDLVLLVWAVGSLGEKKEEATTILVEALSHKSEEVRAEAALALRKFGPSARGAVRVLSGLLEDESRLVRAYAAGALWHITADAKTCLPSLRALAARKEDARVRLPALEFLKDMRGKGRDAEQDVVTALVDPDEKVRGAARLCLSQIRPSNRSVPALVEQARHEDREVRLRALGFLAEIGPVARVKLMALSPLLRDDDPAIGARCARVLSNAGVPARELLQAAGKGLRSDSATTRSVWLSVLVEGIEESPHEILPLVREGFDRLTIFDRELVMETLPTDREAVQVMGLLKRGSADAEASVREAAVRRLDQTGARARSQVPILARLLKDPDVGVRVAAAETLYRLAPTHTSDILTALVEAARHDSWQWKAVSLLGNLGPAAKPAVPVLERLLRSPRDDLRCAAAKALWSVAPDSLRPAAALVELLDRDENKVPILAIDTVGEMRLIEAVPRLTKLLRADLPRRLKAAEALLRITGGSAEARAAIDKALGTEGEALQALDTLSRLDPALRRPLPDLTPFLRKGSPSDRVAVASLVCLLDRKLEKEAVDLLLREGTDIDSVAGWTAVSGLVELAASGVDAAVLALEEVNATGAGGVSGFARRALARRNGPDWHLVRGQARLRRGEIEGAISAFEEAVRLDPKLATARTNLGLACGRQKEYGKAIDHYDAALKSDPDDREALDGRAAIRASCPNGDFRSGKQAVADARRACELSNWLEPMFIETLAAAYAEAEEFGAAVEWQKKALGFSGYAVRHGKKARDRLKLYEMRLPGHE